MHQKSCHSFGLLPPNRYEFDLLIEVLSVPAGQEAVKIFEVKGGGGRKICHFSQAPSTLQYLIWKIEFISVWRKKPKAMAWLLMYVMLAQSTPISYHTEGLVKTEVMSTVDQHYGNGVFWDKKTHNSKVLFYSLLNKMHKLRHYSSSTEFFLGTNFDLLKFWSTFSCKDA